MSAGRIAILIDGGFFLERLPGLVAENRCESPEKIVVYLRHMCRKHVKMLTASQESRWRQYLYRIFFYDAEPFASKTHHPIDNRSIDFGKSEVARERHALFEQLRKRRTASPSPRSLPGPAISSAPKGTISKAPPRMTRMPRVPKSGRPSSSAPSSVPSPSPIW